MLEESEEKRLEFEQALAAYEAMQVKIAKLTDTIHDMSRRKFAAKQFVSSVSRMNEPILEFDEEFWISLVEVAMVPKSGEKKIVFRLRSGEERVISLVK
ncbi:MAG: hypothetical protein Q4G11_05510 [Gallicola sp.]|nr:hypothetical protein [Gallicola sp.]